MFFAVVVGVVLGQVASRITQYFTSSEFKPVRDIADSGITGPATVVLSGISLGHGVGRVGRGGHRRRHPRRPSALGGGSTLFAFYLVALVGIGMLATTGIVVAEDTFGPIADNAQGIAEMSGELDGDTEKILDGLDTVGNTTKAVTKGFAIGSAVIAAVALFASLPRDHRRRSSVSAFDKIAINIADPKTFAGALIGGTVVFLFSSLAILAVGRTAGIVVQEVRRQFREKPGIMDYTEKPDYGPVIDICTGGRAARADHPGPAGGAHARRRRVRPGRVRPRRLSWPRPSSSGRSWRTSCPTPAAPGTTPRSTSRRATTAARAPTSTRPWSSATPSATRSRTPPARPSTR